MKPVRAKKALGQHFLNDKSIAERIADSLSAYDYPIIEVGPGMGVLTEFLLPRYPDIRAIELDTESVIYLHEQFPDLRGKVIEGDFLRLKLDEIFRREQKFMVIGNFPYNISTQIFFHILEYRDLIPAAGGMLQREVAQRLASPPGNKDYGILSVLLQAWYDVEYLFTVSETVFTPPPKVKSGVIRVVRNQRKDLGCDEALFKQVVKTTFNQRRKTIRNSIKPIIGGATLRGDIERYLGLRPEQLGVEDFILLTRSVAELKKENEA